MQVGRGLAETPGVPLVLGHVVEPPKSRLAAHLHPAGVEADRRAVAEDGLTELLARIPERRRPEAQMPRALQLRFERTCATMV